MIVEKEYADGSRTIILEKGDRVELNGWSDDWIAKNGELGTVICRKSGKYASIAFLEVQTDNMRAGGWGVITVPPWQLEFIPPKEDNNRIIIKT